LGGAGETSRPFSFVQFLRLPAGGSNAKLAVMEEAETNWLDLLGKGLAVALARANLPAAHGLERLSGGASMESWRFFAGDQALVLRRAPSAAMMAGRPMDHAGEAALIRAAFAARVAAPEIVVELVPGDGIGTGFIMRAIPGTPDPATILTVTDPARMIADIARELAAIHRMDASQLADLPVMDTANALTELRSRFITHGGDRPVLALALRWLELHIPDGLEPRLVHGDFRLGNLLVDQGRLSGVLDWELAHLGDPHEDLAYGCMTVWRFSRPDRPAFGLVSFADWLEAYRSAGGGEVDPARLRFWLVYRTFWWALGCLQMGGYWRSGSDRSIERVVVARRTAEQELDLLLLLEEEAPDVERTRPLPPATPPLAANTGEPGAGEILTAVSEWLATEVKPLVSGRGAFNLAVARNALGIVTRELALRPTATDALLSADLLSGKVNLADPGLLAQLRRMALDKLTADMPKYPALAIARTQWCGAV
jgi:aminoglycoside phosphotransferase (APT) family kinase protein